MVLTTISGNLGSGKTLFMSAIAVMNPDIPVISNYGLKLDNYEPFDINKFIKKEYDNCWILLDEGYVYLDSRLSMSQKNRLVSYVLFQARKKSLEIFMTMQLRSTIDNRFRELTDNHILAFQTSNGFEYVMFNPKNPIEYREAIITYEMAQEKIFPVYDTNEIITDTTDNFQFMADSEKLEFVKSVAPMFMSEYSKLHANDKGKVKKPTKPQLRIWALEKGYENAILPFLYDYVCSLF